MSRSPDKRRWTDEELFKAACDDTEAFTILTAERVPYIFDLLVALCRSRGVPEAVASTLGLQIVRKAVDHAKDKPTPSGDARRDGLQRLAKQEFDHWCRLNAAILPPPPPTTASHIKLTAEAARERRQLTEKAGHFFRWLPSNYQHILRLVLMGGMTVSEAGRSTGLTASESSQLYHDALARLASFIEVHGRDEFQA
jgi:DNA-directed RNA polymerase specialized sigma24 family protein